MTGRVLTLVAAAIALVGGRAVARDDAPRRVRPVDARLLAWGKYSFPSALAVGNDGCPVVAGITGWARDFPLRNPLQVRWSDNMDCWILKLDPTGREVLFGTLLGGTGMDQVTGCCVGPDGSVFVCGTTTSGDFAVTPGALNDPPEAPHRGYLVRIDPGSGRFLYAAFLGDDQPRALAVGPDGSATIAGWTEASRIAPIRGGEVIARRGCTPGAFAARIAPDGGSRLWRTAIGEPELSRSVLPMARPFAVAVGPDGSTVVAGVTNSPTFPKGRPVVRPGALIAPSNAFAVRLDPEGKVVQETLVAEGSFSMATGVAVDGDGVAWVVGAESAGEFEPLDDSPWKEKGDPRRSRIFIVRLDRACSRLSRTVVEGGVLEMEASIALRPGGAWIGGRTASPGFAGIPPDEKVGPWGRRFVAAVDADGELQDAVHVPLPADLGGGFAPSPTGDLFVRGTFRPADPGVIDPKDAFAHQGWLVRCSRTPLPRRRPATGPWTLPPVPGWEESVAAAGNASVADRGVEEKEGASAGKEGGTPFPTDGLPSDATTTAGSDSGREDGGAGAAADPTLETHKGILRNRPEAGTDLFRLEGRLAAETRPGEGLADFDPATTPLRVTMGDLLYPFVLEIWPGDPGWIERRESLFWKSPEDGRCRARIRIHRESGRFEVEASGFDFPGPQRNPIQVKVEALAPLGQHEAVWAVRGDGVLHYR